MSRPVPGSGCRSGSMSIRGDNPAGCFTRIRRFGDVTLNRLTDQAVYHILQVRQGQAGITKCSPHDLRRTFATAMLENRGGFNYREGCDGPRERHHHPAV